MDFLKKSIGYIIIGTLLVAVGVFLGLTCKKDVNGAFFKLFNPLDDKNESLLIVVGETIILKVPNDFNKLDDDLINMLSTRISKLVRDAPLSEILRDLRDEAKEGGPFGAKDHEVTLKFSDVQELNGYVAGACKSNKELFKKKFSLITEDRNRTQDCRTFIEMNFDECNTGNNIIWISETTARKFLNIKEPDSLPESLKITAKELGKL